MNFDQANSALAQLRQTYGTNPIPLEKIWDLLTGVENVPALGKTLLLYAGAVRTEGGAQFAYETAEDASRRDRIDLSKRAVSKARPCAGSSDGVH